MQYLQLCRGRPLRSSRVRDRRRRLEDVSNTRVDKPWTTCELAVLREHAREGAATVAEMLGRSVAAVQRMAYRQRISLRTPGTLRGRVLGQPAGVSLRPDMRSDMASGEVDAEAVVRRMEIARDAELCPCCGKRPATVRSTGWCTVCHKRNLTEAHLEEIDEIEAQRALWAARQKVKRARDREACPA